MSHNCHLPFLVAAIAAAMPTIAVADAIDGAWCVLDGRRITIQGPNIVTPGGKSMTGQYGRHDFSYVVPLTEPQAGATVNMVLRGEYLMMRKVGDGPLEE